MSCITDILATADAIVIKTDLDSGKDLTLCEYPMNTGRDTGTGTPLHFRESTKEGCRTLSIARAEGGRDRIYSKFAVLRGDEKLAGPCCITDFDTPAWDYPYPSADTIKGLQVRMIDDAIAIGVRHAAINISQPTVMMPAPGEDTLTFECGGREFYFLKSYIEKFDARVRELSENGIVVSLILLNSMKWDGLTVHPDMEPILAHPDFDREGFISAFNMVTEQGLAHYVAFVEFVASRYMRSDKKYGRACGLIVGNEVDSQWVWGNAGHKSAQEYVSEYAVALRLTWLAARKYYTHARAYVSLDHFWTLRYTADGAKAYSHTQTYSGREILDNLVSICESQGDFPWALAYHPYPEDLNNPDFWNDKTAQYSLETGRVTFKNLEVLCAWFNRAELLYRGQQRPIILSEQGFNSKETDESEKLQSAAYCLAYQKVLCFPQIEAFILHAHVDNRDEFGLNLGIWRRDKDSGSANEPLSPKPIYTAFKGIGTAEGKRICQDAREAIGTAIWDDILQTKECT
jgi:hypothetical protein